jgi:hypothetical protein
MTNCCFPGFELSEEVNTVENFIGQEKEFSTSPESKP